MAYKACPNGLQSMPDASIASLEALTFYLARPCKQRFKWRNHSAMPIKAALHFGRSKLPYMGTQKLDNIFALSALVTRVLWYLETL